MKLNWKKIAGIGLPIIGGLISLATGALEDQKRKDEIAEEVQKALAEASKKN